jgi:hypothetical protein
LLSGLFAIISPSIEAKTMRIPDEDSRLKKSAKGEILLTLESKLS